MYQQIKKTVQLIYCLMILFNILLSTAYAQIGSTRIFLGTDGSSGVTSYDFGRTWQLLPNPPIGINTNINNSLLTPNINLLGTNNNGVFASFDQGKIWQQVPDFSHIVNGTNFIKQYDGEIFVGADDGFFRTVDNGHKWEKLLTYRTIYMAKSDNYIFVYATGTGDDKYFLRSIDGGKTWATVNITSVKYPSVTELIQKGSTVIVGTEFSGVFLSDDSGNSWKKISLHVLGTPNMSDGYFFGGNIFLNIAYNGVFFSSDNGVTWQKLPSLPDVEKTLFYSNGEAIIAATFDGGLFMSNNKGLPKTWVKVDAVPDDTLITSFSWVGTNMIVGTESKGAFLSTDNGQHWVNLMPSIIQPFTSVSTVAIQNKAKIL